MYGVSLWASDYFLCVVICVLIDYSRGLLHGLQASWLKHCSACPMRDGWSIASEAGLVSKHV